MKITKSQLRRIIQEELQYVLYEQNAPITVDDPQSDPDSPLYSKPSGGLPVAEPEFEAGRENHNLPATYVQPRGEAGFDRLSSPTLAGGSGPSAEKLQGLVDKGYITPGQQDNAVRTGNVQGTESPARVAARQRLNAPLAGPSSAELAAKQQFDARLATARAQPSQRTRPAPAAVPATAAAKFDPNDRRSINAAHKSGAINQDEWRTARRSLANNRRA
jgi:hypothetical protein